VPKFPTLSVFAILTDVTPESTRILLHGPAEAPLSIRAGVVLQLALVALRPCAPRVFALKVIEVTLQRRT